MYEVIVKQTNDCNKFRQAAINFEKHGTYCNYPRGTSEFKKYWDEETRRSLEGFTSEDGEWISGYFYFYLNYSPIMTVVEREVTRNGKVFKKSVRERNFPDFWDYDRAFFDAVEEAEKQNKHLTFLKPRGVGASFKGGSMLARNYALVRNSTSFAVTEETEHLTKDGILTKAFDVIDFVNQNTAWYKKSQKINTKMHKRASFIQTTDGKEFEAGYKSEIIGFSVKNDPDKGRGKRGMLCVVDEIGLVTSPIHMYSTLRHGFEQGDDAFGLILLQGTGGCLCAGQKVWTNSGELVNIEDLKIEQGILGFNGTNVSKEFISYWQSPKQKTCVKITTNTLRTLECSEDHPILKAVINKDHRILGNTFTEASFLQQGDKIAVIDEVPLFGNTPMWEPRLVGWLIGDGSYGNKQTPILSNCEIEINNYVESRFKTHTTASYITKSSNKVYKETSISEIIPMLRELGIYGQTKLNKRLPSNTHGYSKYSLQELIGGLFDTDGYVAIRQNKKRNTFIAEISIAQASLELINEIRLLLQKFGIHGRVRSRQPRPNNPKDKNSWYEFTIADTRSLLRFADNITLFPSEKQKRLTEIKEVFSNVKPWSVHDGIRYESILSIENIGIRDVYNLTADVTHTYIGNGIITHNTQDADYSEMRKLFYEPEAYNFLPVKNDWDDGMANTSCGFFWPRYYNDGKFMDSNGNSIVDAAKEHELKERQRIIETSSDRNHIDRHVAERPFCPQEALLQTSQNIFPKKELLLHLTNIRNNEKLKNFKQVGDLLFNETGVVKWKPTDKPKDITSYRLKKEDDMRGQIVIWEHPADNPPYGLYIMGLDPYDHDQASTSTSLGSCFVYKRYQNFESYYDLPVAEYTGRPDTVEEFYEECRKLALYYNAKILYENEKKGLFIHFAHKNAEYMLADQPNLVNDIVQSSNVKRGKGIHMNKQIKQYLELRIRDWLNTEYETGKKNLNKILSEPLLEELIEYNPDGNFDRVISFGLCIMYNIELYQHKVKESKDNTFRTTIFKNRLFGESSIEANPFSSIESSSWWIK